MWVDPENVYLASFMAIFKVGKRSQGSDALVADRPEAGRCNAEA
jgi:hypothetical protein